MNDATAKLLHAAKYLTSAHRLDQLPPDLGAEVAFVGRSNAGKSSAINALCEHRGLARTSRTPGRTQQIVLFELDASRRLTDLPGFGYAKVSAKLRAHWDRTLDAYLRTRQCLAGVVLIMDARHPLKDFDRQMLAWCEAAELPCHALLTKADKLSQGARVQTLRQVTAAITASSQSSAQLFSAKTAMGRDDVRRVIGRWLKVE